MTDPRDLDFTRVYTIPSLNLSVNDAKAFAYALEAAEEGFEITYGSDFGTTFTSKEVHPRILAIIQEKEGEFLKEIIRIDMDDGE